MSDPAPRPSPTPGDDERLSSWKEIAAYLGRDVRTVQRWERTQGLPVRRHQHHRLTTAYAYKSELDTWWRNEEGRGDAPEGGRDPQEPAPTPIEPVPEAAPGSSTADPRSTRTRHLMLAATVVLTLVVGLLVGQIASGGGTLPADPGGETWALVTAVDNRTGEPIWTGTIEHLLRQQLAGSPVVRLASSDRVRDALQLMQRPPDIVLDLATARELCLRDGDIRSLIASRLDRFGSRYELAIDLIAPLDGRVIASRRLSAAQPDDLPSLIEDHARWIQQALGAHARTLAQLPRTARVATRSLEALQLYSKGNELGLQGQWAGAAKLLEAAIARDPQFSTAHILLAYALENTGAPAAAVLQQASLARAEAGTAPEAERYFVEASYLTFEANAHRGIERDRLTRAAAAYEALLAIDPTHYWGANNLMFTYQRLGRYDRAAPLAVQLARERPNDARLQTLAAVALTAWRGDLEAAAGFVRRARELRDAGAPIRAEARAWVDLFDAHVAWAGGDIETARAIVDEVAARLPSMNDGLDVYAQRVGNVYLGLGRCRDARKAFERMRRDDRHEFLAMAALDCDDAPGFERHLLEDVGAGEQPSYARVMFGARTGRLADAATWIDDFEHRFSNRVTPIVGRGELAAARKEWATALRYFEEAWEVLRFRGEDRSPRVAVQMADAYAAQGRTDRALEVLELTAAMRARVYDASPPGAMAWIRAQVALARLLRRIGREREATVREDLVRMLLRDADRDLPLVRQFEAR